MDDPSQHVAPPDRTLQQRMLRRHRALLVQTLMWPRIVEIVNICAEHPLQMPLIEHAQLISARRTHRAHPALSERMRLWCLIGRSDDRATRASKYRVKGGRERGIPIVDQQP